MSVLEGMLGSCVRCRRAVLCYHAAGHVPLLWDPSRRDRERCWRLVTRWIESRLGRAVEPGPGWSQAFGIGNGAVHVCLEAEVRSVPETKPLPKIRAALHRWLCGRHHGVLTALGVDFEIDFQAEHVGVACCHGTEVGVAWIEAWLEREPADVVETTVALLCEHALDQALGRAVTSAS